MSQMERARAHLAEGDFDRAILGYRAAAQEESGGSVCFELAVTLSLAGRWVELQQVVSEAEVPIFFFQSVCVYLLRIGECQVLCRMHASIPQSQPIYPVAMYFAGVSLVAAQRYRESLEFFHRFKLGVRDHYDQYAPLLHLTNMNVMFRQGTLVEPPEVVGAIDDGTIAVEERVPVVEMRHQAQVGGDSLLYASCLNDSYFFRFGDSLVSSLRGSCGAIDLHFHVVGEPDECCAHFDLLVKRYPAVRLGLSLEREPLYRHAVYYACDRFIVLPQLLDIYHRDIVMLDADALIERDLMGLFEPLRRGAGSNSGADFACFDTGGPEPAAVYQASLMYFADSRGSRAFLRLLRHFIVLKLDPPQFKWMIDQAALFSVVLYLEGKNDRRFRFQRLNRLTEMAFEDYVASDASTEEKRTLKGQV